MMNQSTNVTMAAGSLYQEAALKKVIGGLVHHLEGH